MNFSNIAILTTMIVAQGLYWLLVIPAIVPAIPAEVATLVPLPWAVIVIGASLALLAASLVATAIASLVGTAIHG